MSVVLVTSALFSLGLYGVLTRREAVAVLASVEVMLGAANVQLVAFAGGSAAAGQAAALLVLVVAAAEAAVGLALVIALSRRTGRVRMDEITEVRG